VSGPESFSKRILESDSGTGQISMRPTGRNWGRINNELRHGSLEMSSENESEREVAEIEVVGTEEGNYKQDEGS